MSIRFVKPVMPFMPFMPFTKRFFLYKSVSPIIVSPLIVSMFITGAVYTSIISELRMESLYMKRYREEIMERLRRIERK
jgi:hypothetical protein